MVDVILKKRSFDWQTHLSGNEGVWECGKTKTEALRQMKITLRRGFTYFDNSNQTSNTYS